MNTSIENSPQHRNAWDAAVQGKRAEQRAKGYTTEHDREHGVEHLLLWAQDYASRGRHLDAAALVEAAREVLFWQRTVKSDYDVIDDQYRGALAAVAPPSIANMAPGERSCHNSAQHSTHLWFPAPFDSKFGDMHYTCPGYVDPSTIRDVSPPKEQS